MNSGEFVFTQVFDLIHPERFRRCVARYGGDYKTKSFSCWSQFFCVGFGQRTFRESLREIEVCFNSRGAQLYHLGWSGPICRSTLADANHGRDWRILGLFPWAHFRPTKSAVKLHTVLDLRGSIPTAITITEGKRGDVRILDELLLEAGSLYIIDRGYMDFRRLHRFVQASAFFITRGKRRLKFTVPASRAVDAATGLGCDQLIRLSYWKSRDDYPQPLRRIGYTDPATGQRLVFLTNNLIHPPLVIAALYRQQLASGTVFQMDQTTSAHQTLLWQHRQRRAHANLGRRLRSRPRPYCQEDDQIQPQPDHDFANPERQRI